MKRIHVVCALVLAACAPAAMAAGAGGQAPANFNWSGAYAGVNIGGGFGTFKHPVSLSGGAEHIDASLDFTAGGFLGGAQVGYNFQSGRAVYGVELDLQGAGVEGSGSLDVHGNILLPPGGVSGEIGTKVDWFSTLRGRIGYLPTDRFLIYGTGGLAYGRVHTYLNANIGGSSLAQFSKTGSETGWVVGLGAEYAITDRVTIKSEYMYVDLGKQTLFHMTNPEPPNVDVQNDVAFQVIRVGLNYKF